MSDRKFDVVVWGASGFTGRLVAEYLIRQDLRDLRWALGGRNQQKLEEVRGELARREPRAAHVPIVTADANDEASLRALAKSTRVIATTVGPFRKLGPPLVAACAREGTHYCDLTGEPHFVRDMIEAHDEEARGTGARIVHCCGFDSIPSDLGVLILQEHAREKFGRPLEEIRMVTGAVRGGISGGTIASALLLAEESVRSKKVRRQLANPYLLDPSRDEEHARNRDQTGIRFDADAGRWTAPFVMAAINTRVVQRSNALLDYRYGRDFRYTESMGLGRGVKGAAQAMGVTAGLGGFFVTAATKPGRSLLQKVLPAAGEGPPKEKRDQGHFTLEFFGSGHDASGAAVKAKAVSKGTSDPGYGETAKMLGESALCLALDGEKLAGKGGVQTPAAAMGTPLVERLRRAGMTFDVVS